MILPTLLTTHSPEEDLIRRFPELEQADEDVLLGILAGGEGLPALVSKVVAAEFNLGGRHW